MPLRVHSKIPVRFYVLEPGDATRYRFFLVDLAQPHEAHIFPGTGRTGGGYVGVGILMPGRQGFYEMRKDTLDHIEIHAVQYYASHTGVLPYTVSAILLAASVLIKNPDDLDGACKAMLGAPDILKSQ